MNTRTRIRVNGAHVIPAAESRPTPITPRQRTTPPKTPMPADVQLARAVKQRYAGTPLPKIAPRRTP